MTTTYSPPRPVATPARIAGATAQLAALGVIGPGVFALLATLLGLGLGLLPVLGIGLLFLLLFVYVLFALSWLENARIDGLYRFGLPPRRPRRSDKSGFGGFLHTIWLQFIDPGMWRAVANGAIATVLGWIVLSLVGIAASGVVLAFSPLYAGTADAVRLGSTWIDVSTAWAVPVGVVASLLALATIVGLAFLHGHTPPDGSSRHVTPFAAHHARVAASCWRSCVVPVTR